MVDLAESHPELGRRYGLLQQRCWERGWDVWIVSSTRSEETQRYWYALYLANQWQAIVADPDRDAGDTPFGWRAHGSLHMVQQDGYSHALDIAWRGAWPWELHAVADTCGLRFPEPTENWHMQAFDAYSYGFYPVQEPPPEEVMAQPIGNIDEVRNNGDGTAQVQGWALDPDEPDKSIDVHIYVGAQVYGVTADRERTDVNEVMRVGGNHGIDARVSLTDTVEINVYGIDASGDPSQNAHLGKRQVLRPTIEEAVRAELAKWGIVK